MCELFIEALGTFECYETVKPQLAVKPSGECEQVSRTKLVIGRETGRQLKLPSAQITAEVPESRFKKDCPQQRWKQSQGGGQKGRPWKDTSKSECCNRQGPLTGNLTGVQRWNTVSFRKTPGR